MGLDQNWVAKLNDTEYETIHYHRKFNALQGFMTQEWEAAGHTEEFNLEYLPVTEDMLDKLEVLIVNDELEPTAGFFFGSYEKDENYWDAVEELKTIVIPKVRKKIKQGKEIFYTCWY